VADNIVADIAGRSATAQYDGYGSCPLTVERGKIVLAEFGYGGALKPSFPRFLIDGTKPSRLAWFLKESLLPPIYWKAMLRGKEWLAKPEKVSAR
jgi:sulfide:quinone oxidoreductase